MGGRGQRHDQRWRIDRCPPWWNCARRAVAARRCRLQLGRGSSARGGSCWLSGDDSVTLDHTSGWPLKYEIGGLLVRRGELLSRAFAIRPEYMKFVEPGSGEVNFADHGIALTRRFRALKVWLSFQVLGVEWFRQLIRHCLALTDYARALLEQAGFEIVCPGPLSVVCFRPVLPGRSPEQVDEHVRHVIDAVRGSGEAFLSSTRLQGRDVLRLCFVNWRTTAEDVERVVELLAKGP
jgi:glutamate/tyrosine decarboxylase-like PLP-dependent enzyme